MYFKIYKSKKKKKKSKGRKAPKILASISGVREETETMRSCLADGEECVLGKGESVRKERAGTPVQMLLLTHIVKEETEYCSWYNW